MRNVRSKSSVDSITSVFQKKFKDKLNFIDKHGNICHIFEKKDPNIVIIPPKRFSIEK